MAAQDQAAPSSSATQLRPRLLSSRDQFRLLPPEEQKRRVDGLSEADALALLWNWRQWWARPNQIVPEGDWVHWLVLAGRGFGKTRTGAETIKEWATVPQGAPIHLVAPTAGDIRKVMIEGSSGLLSCYHHSDPNRPDYEPSKGHLLSWPNGNVGYAFSADEPERLRGPQCGIYWADELAAWRFGEEAWDNLMFGFRLGRRPRGIITSTPKPIKIIKDIVADPATFITRGSTYDNRDNLAPAFFDHVVRKYEGTRIGRQELLAEILDDIPGALWSMGIIDASRWRTANVDDFIRVVVAIDPAVSQMESSADTGICVAALLRNGHVAILDDLTCHESPLGWARVALAAFRSRKADRIVGEINNGGDLVEANIRAIDASAPFRCVRASRGKALRAEPVVALYEQGRVHHVGAFPEMETQMCSFVPGAPRSASERLDRMDALVWAVTELVVDVEEESVATPMFSRVSISRF